MSKANYIDSNDSDNIGYLVDENQKLLLVVGTTVPTDTAAGYAKGCIFLDSDASASSIFYINEGSSTSCDFNVGAPSETLADLSDTDITTPASGNMLLYDGSNSWDNKALSGDATIDNAGVMTLAANSVITTDITDLNVTTAKLAANAVTSGKIAIGVLQVVEVTIPTADVLTLNGTPIELVAAPGADTYIVVDKVTASVDYAGVAYTTNTTVEIRYTDGSGTKVTADIAAILDATADKANSVGGIEAELVHTANAALVAVAATGNPAAGTSDIKFTVSYRVLSIV